MSTREEQGIETYLQKRFGKNWDSRPHSNECDCDACGDWCRLWHEYEDIQGIEGEWVLTFGSGHRPWGDCHCVISAKSISAARAKVIKAIGSHWSGIYRAKNDLNDYISREVSWAEVMLKPPKSAHAEV